MRFAFLVSQMLGYQIPDLFRTHESFVEFEKALKLLRENGFEGVEVNLNLDDEQLLARIGKALERSELKLAAVGTGMLYAVDKLSFTDPTPSKRFEAVSKVTKLIRFAAEHQAIVIIGLVRGAGSFESKENVTALRECLRACDAEASGCDGKIALEAINRYETKSLNTAEHVAEFIDDSGLKATGILLDTFHMNIEERSIESTIRSYVDRLIHFHIADSNRWPPGYGHLDIREQLKILAELDYSGWVSAETLPRPSSLESVVATAEYLAKCSLSRG
ncbi:MAG: TIM barrel protein [Candidatus Bathyarchaeia archaeon]